MVPIRDEERDDPFVGAEVASVRESQENGAPGYASIFDDLPAYEEGGGTETADPGDETFDRTVSRILEEQREDPTVPVPTLFVTGAAGTGKTFALRKMAAEKPQFAILTATTGIAGVNLDTTTIHALLRYYNTESLQENYRRGKTQTLLHAIAQQYENVVVDEASMIDGLQLDIWYRAIAEVNEYQAMQGKHRKLGLILTGDFCQLPPVKADWAFNAESWPLFAKNTLRLTKMWRQGDAKFLAALNLLRAGDGEGAVEILKDLVHWRSAVDLHMANVTTIMAKNDAVDRHNWMMLRELPGPYIDIPSKRQGQLLRPWEKYIPERLQLKIGALVMILINAKVERGFFDFNTDLPYANGDCGHVREVNIGSRTISVELIRSGAIVEVPLITRPNLTREAPDLDPETGEVQLINGFKPYLDSKSKKWVIGEITYMPLRVAYAATVHKTQGLTLDGIQVDSTAHFFGSPAMAYVALSRARTPDGVHIIGTPEKFARKVKIAEEVRPWL